MENVDMNAITAIAWFFGGIFTYRILTRLLNYGYMVNVYKEILLSMLMLLKVADENFQRGNDYFLESATKTEKDAGLAKIDHESNEKVLHVWRNLIIGTITQLTPRHFRGLIQFTNWRQAMKYLETKGNINASD